MILDLESICINFELIEARKLEQKIHKQHLVSLLKRNKDTGNVSPKIEMDHQTKINKVDTQT